MVKFSFGLCNLGSFIIYVIKIFFFVANVCVFVVWDGKSKKNHEILRMTSFMNKPQWEQLQNEFDKSKKNKKRWAENKL